MIFKVAADNGSTIQLGGASTSYCRMLRVAAFYYLGDAACGVIRFNHFDLRLGGKKLFTLGQGCRMRLYCFNLRKHRSRTAN